MTRKTSQILGALLLLLVVQCATAASWGPFMSDGCPRPGFLLYTASLVNFTGIGLAVCRQTPADIAGQHVACSKSCVSNPIRVLNSDIIGIFLIPDPSCASTADFTQSLESKALHVEEAALDAYVEKLP